MDHAAVEARREKILPGDLLQGILRLPITLIYLARSPDATCWTLSNYFQARNFARFTVHRIPDRPVIDPLPSPCFLYQRTRKTSILSSAIPSSKQIRNFVNTRSMFLPRRNERKEKCCYIFYFRTIVPLCLRSIVFGTTSRQRQTPESQRLFLPLWRNLASIPRHFKTGTASSRRRSMPASTINPFIAYSCLV